MKNIITFRLWMSGHVDTKDIINVLKYLFNKNKQFLPKECLLDEITNHEFSNFDIDYLDNKVKEALENDDIMVLEFLTENKKEYFHFTIKKGKNYQIKFDIKNTKKEDFLNDLIDFYYYAIEKFNPQIGFAHDFEDAKNTFSNITINAIRKIYWINVYGKELMSVIENIDEIKALEFNSVKFISKSTDDNGIGVFRMCEEPNDIKSSKFSLLAEAFSVKLSKNKKISVQTPEKIKHNTIKPCTIQDRSKQNF